MGKDDDKDVPLLHIYSQKHPHDDALIISSRSGLLRLKEAIDNALENGEADCVVATSDLESYEIKVILNEENWKTEFWQRLQYPFSEDGIQDGETLSVDDIISYKIRTSKDVKNTENTRMVNQKYSQELTVKAKDIVEKNTQREFMKILDSNDINRLDEYVKYYGINHMVNGASVLFWAVYGNKLLFVIKLLELGADPNLKDSNGRSTLEVGAHYGFYEVCKGLLEKGAKIDKAVWRRANEGWGGNAQKEIIEMLREWQKR